MNVLNGTNLTLLIDDLAMGGATTHTLTVVHEPRETSRKETGAWRAREDGMLDWTVDAEGFVIVQQAGGYDALVTAMIARAPVDVLITTEQTGDTEYAGQAFITNIDATGPHQDNTTYSISLEGAGPLTPAIIE